MILNELFVKPTGIDWNLTIDKIRFAGGDHTVAYETDLPDQSKLQFYAVDKKSYWIVEFGVKSKEDRDFNTGITGTGNAALIFGAVAECLRKFIAQKNPWRIKFTASAKEPSRGKLYAVLAKKIAGEMHWRCDIKKGDQVTTYTISEPTEPDPTA
jgi:hypothetical protein